MSVANLSYPKLRVSVPAANLSWSLLTPAGLSPYLLRLLQGSFGMHQYLGHATHLVLHHLRQVPELEHEIAKAQLRQS